MSTTNYRSDIINNIAPYFRTDERYYLLVCDMGFGVIDQLKEEFPKRIINCGIMEQGTVGIAAGMSMSGLIPIVYSIVNFLVFRAIEQIRNDIVLQNLNVKLIATGANDYFKFLGPSHCCGSDDITLMELIHMNVYDPYSETKPFKEIVDEWIQADRAGYIRV
ncbi:MAG: transketolase [Candidatus Scalindua sp.]|nr:transketolase [Candidatus Scalindua sp.]MBT6230139.1 transketolase [Candidatus Scalindua sp.]